MNLRVHFLPYPADLMAGRPPTRQAPRFGQRLAALRKERGLSQQVLAQRLNTTRNNVAYYERKADNPTLDFIERCAQVLEVPTESLIADNPKTRSAKPGPPARFEQLLRQLNALPRGKQRVVIEMLEGFLQKAGG